jgi:MDMPI C-terminal domain
VIRVTPAGVTVADASPAAPAAATVQGEPQAVLLWLWRRTTGYPVQTSGDAALITELRDLLGHATV